MILFGHGRHHSTFLLSKIEVLVTYNLRDVLNDLIWRQTRVALEELSRRLTDIVVICFVPMYVLTLSFDVRVDVWRCHHCETNAVSISTAGVMKYVQREAHDVYATKARRWKIGTT